MIKNILFTGDKHGDFFSFSTLDKNKYPPEETMVIIAGDVGVNIGDPEIDKIHKKNLANFGYTIYCLRGNHDLRPSYELGFEQKYDENVDGEIWFDPQFPNIRYLIDGVLYTINGGTTMLPIGGAYSIDKDYRLKRGWFWTPDEQLNEQERQKILDDFSGTNVDIMLSHTCPLDWEPSDLFLKMVDQNLVDKSMEIWLNEVAKKINWKQWIWGHYHADRVYKDGKRFILFNEFKTLEEIINPKI